MDIAHILRDILFVLIAAKIAAEGAERLGIPAVVGEIVAGLLIGPSVLGIVGGGDEVLRTLGELGVILLLLDVGLEMDLRELGKVGRASMSVATIGVIAPMVLGLGAMLAVGESFNTALFIGAALTATSVGITARVFGDLRALATTEARIVLGAAVADDVMGLVVLTVVVRLVTQGSVSVLSVGGIIALAVGFLVVGGLVGLRLAPPLFGLVEKVSRSTGTMVAIALAFALGFAEIANLAKLAPIVGAFVAGLALAKTRQRDGIRRELAPVGHLFIPVFFLQIGIDADVSAFGEVAVLRNAAILLVIAAVGKMVAAFGLLGTRADRWIVGFGMLPRGEVGLIFATIGLANGVLDQELYASLLLVVLVTTVAAPQLLKFRYARLRSVVKPVLAGGLPMTLEPPQGGWLRVVDGLVRLAATPPPDRALTVALDAALEMTDARPSSELLDYLGTASGGVVWNDRASASLRKVVERGSARSWRFLETVGVLDRALPELAQTMRARYADPFQLDATHTHRWGALERIRDLPAGSALRAQYDRLEHPEWLLLASLLVEGLDGHANASAAAAGIVGRVGFGPVAEREVVGLVEDDGILRSAAARPGAFDEEEMLQLASHLDTPERARASYLLAVCRDDALEDWEQERLASLHELIQRSLTDEELTGAEARNLIERRRTEAMLLARDRPEVVERIRHAPRSYIARQQPSAVFRHAVLTEPPLRPNAVRISVTPADEDRDPPQSNSIDLTGLPVAPPPSSALGRPSSSAERPKWQIEVGALDRPGLMAAVTGVLSRGGFDVDRAVVATWGDDAAIESFIVSSVAEPNADELSKAVEEALDRPLEVPGVPGAEVVFDDLASPWHTVCEVSAPDMPGLLHALSGVFAAASVEIRSAGIGHSGSKVVDRFEVVGRDGPRLSEDERRLIRTYLASGVRGRQRRFRRGFVVEAAPTA